MPTFGLGHVWFLLIAAGWTLALSAIAFIGGGILGFVIALMKVSDNRLLRGIASAYVQIVQGTPLLILLFLIYFGVAILGFNNVPALLAAGAGLTIYASGFLGEIWRGCIEAIPRGQLEAAQALNLKYTARMRDVILPQAFRIALAPTVGYMVQIIKGTSLAAIIGFTEITRAGQIINNATFQPLEVFTTVAALYFVICWPLSLLAA